jgi:hypothetical protein
MLLPVGVQSLGKQHTKRKEMTDSIEIVNVRKKIGEVVRLVELATVEVELELENNKRQKLDHMHLVVQQLSPASYIDESKILKIIIEAYEYADGEYGIERAIEWGLGFEWPQEVIIRDKLIAERNHYNLEHMIKEQQNKTKNNRMSKERVKKLFLPEDPDYQRLMDLADGMVIYTGDEFVLNESPSMLRQLYLKVQNAVNKMLVELWESG